jgi:DNA-binding Lrp family transcriptional regulator
MAKTIVKLTGEKELRVFMHPLRQKILRTMQVAGSPMTAKQLADLLGITPSGAKHHLKQLEVIGLVGFHHTELIHGITATYYCHLPVTVSIGLDGGDLADDRLAVSENMLMSVFGGFRKRYSEMPGVQNTEHFAGDVLTGVMHLKQEDADALYNMITQYIDAHEAAGEDTAAFEYALVLYRAGDSRP